MAETQGSYDISQLARIERGGAGWRLVLMFARWPIMRYNAMKQEYNRVTGGKFEAKHTPAAAYIGFWTVVFPAILEAAMMTYLFGREKDEDDEEQQLANFAASAAARMTIGVAPVVGRWGEGLVEAGLGKKGFIPPVRGAPVLSAFEQGKQIVTTINKAFDEDEEVDPYDAALTITRGAGWVFPFTRPFEKAIMGQQAIEEGEAEEGLRPYIVGG